MIRAPLTAAAAVFLLVLSGCGGEQAAAPGYWDGVTELRPAGGALDVEAFRLYADGVDEPWERDPETLVRSFLGIEAGAFSRDGDRAQLLRDSLEDDSVRAERWVLRLARDGEAWTVASARWEQRCHDGRGHQDFRAELCL